MRKSAALSSSRVGVGAVACLAREAAAGILGTEVKPGRPLFLLIGVTLLGAIASFNDMTPGAQAFDVVGRTAWITDAKPPAPAGNPLWAIPLEQLSITRERPIFSPSRRAPPPVPAYVAPVAVQRPVKAPERPAVSLLGTVIGTDVQIAVFLETETKNVVRLRVNDNHQGWVLRLVKAREVTLVKNGEQVALELPPPGEAPAVGTPTVPPPVPDGPPGAATRPIVNNANYVDEQPTPVRGARR